MPQYYRPAPDDVTTVDEVVRRLVDSNEMADGIWWVETESLRPYIEYHWNRNRHRAGSVPIRRKKDKWGSLVYATMRGAGEGSFDADHFMKGNRWDRLVSWMQKYGWDKRDPAHVDVDSDGNANLSEGNHRVNVALEIGLERVPVQFHLVRQVRKSTGAF